MKDITSSIPNGTNTNQNIKVYWVAKSHIIAAIIAKIMRAVSIILPPRIILSFLIRCDQQRCVDSQYLLLLLPGLHMTPRCCPFLFLLRSILSANPNKPLNISQTNIRRNTSTHTNAINIRANTVNTFFMLLPPTLYYTTFHGLCSMLCSIPLRTFHRLFVF